MVKINPAELDIVMGAIDETTEASEKIAAGMKTLADMGIISNTTTRKMINIPPVPTTTPTTPPSLPLPAKEETLFSLSPSELKQQKKKKSLSMKRPQEMDYLIHICMVRISDELYHTLNKDVPLSMDEVEKLILITSKLCSMKKLLPKRRKDGRLYDKENYNIINRKTPLNIPLAEEEKIKKNKHTTTAMMGENATEILGDIFGSPDTNSNKE